jgi:tetratricopeptide (TPR) repeat protein
MSRPRSRTIFFAIGLLVVVALAILVGLRLSPKAREARHLARGDLYFNQQRYREAALEYTNVLQVQATHARATRQLGLAHYMLGELEPARRHLTKSQELEPSDIEVRLKLAAIHLVARQPEEAYQQAAAVLEREPTNLDALVLLAA